MTLKGWRLFLNRALFIPQRYVLGVLGLFALGNSFTIRVSLSMTITQMVLQKASEAHIVGETCPDPEATVISNTTSIADTIDYIVRDKYDWSEATQGLLLSAFYYGYVVTHLPGGLLAERFGGKWTCGLGLLISSLATLLTPWSVTVGGSTGLFIVRVLCGLGEGPVTPSFVLLLARWVPASERSRFGAMIFGGAQIGNIFGPIISGYIMADGGDWANVFYVFGGLGVIWFLFWCLLCYSTPNSHPFISDEERNYLNANVMASGLHKKLDPVPFRAILTSKPLWVFLRTMQIHVISLANLNFEPTGKLAWLMSVCRLTDLAQQASVADVCSSLSNVKATEQDWMLSALSRQHLLTLAVVCSLRGSGPAIMAVVCCSAVSRQGHWAG
ncbi:major facilitator superfamily domain-containing protein [Phthorimaea operculella]|nr:major facilitator superfamily domain-containing protein [Phthorimaea operculella]